VGGPVKGQADYLVLGDYNAACSMCGRKRKASQLVRNWQGLYRCPEHNEPRQPQDFARGIKENMGVPWAQTEQILFTSFNLTFPVVISPSPMVLPPTSVNLLTESGQILYTEGGSPITTETAAYEGTVVALIPSYIIPTSFQWAWLSGGDNITIESPNASATALYGILTIWTADSIIVTADGYPLTWTADGFQPVSGVLQVTVTSSLGGIATAQVNVSI